jgi:hypothetical protein
VPTPRHTEGCACCPVKADPGRDREDVLHASPTAASRSAGTVASDRSRAGYRPADVENVASWLCPVPQVRPRISTGSSSRPNGSARSPSAASCTPATFDQLVPQILATATVHRLHHHAHACRAGGVSVRLSQVDTGRERNH